MPSAPDAGDVLQAVVDVGDQLFGERLAGDDRAGRGDLDRRLGIAQGRDHDLLALLDERREDEDDRPAQVLGPEQELALVIVGMDDLEDDPAGFGEVEDEASLGVRFRFEAARPMQDDSAGDGILDAPDNRPADFRGPGLGRDG